MMKLYNGISPNGLRVTIFLAEKKIEVPTQQINIIGGEARQEAFRKINPLPQVPVLELDDGVRLTESIAICRYLERLNPEPALFGKSSQEEAVIEMWMRRIELNLFDTISSIGLHELEFFKDTLEQNASYTASQRREFARRLAWFDEAMSDGRLFVAGKTFSIADIVGMGMLFLMQFSGVELPPKLTHARRWETAMKARPSFPGTP